MKLCICDCNRPVTGKSKYHDHPSCEYTYFAMMKQCGMIPAKDWKICNVCGEWFPVFPRTYHEPTTCPAFVADCNKMKLKQYGVKNEQL